MNLLALRYFVEVAKNLNFTEASKKLHVSQPGISQQIHMLEEQLGIKLLHRTTRKVELTEEGKYLFEKVVHSFEQIEHTISNIMDATKAPGVLKIATIPTAASLFLPKVMKALHEQFPSIEFSILETNSAMVTQLIKNKEFHIGFIRTVGGRPSTNQDGIEYLELERSTIGAVVSAHHKLAARKTISLRELKEDIFLNYDSHHSAALHKLVQTACQTAGFTPKTIGSGFELMTIANIVADNLGVTLMPMDMFKLIDPNKGVVYLELEDTHLEISIAAIWEQNPYMRKHVKALIQLLMALKEDR
ncbi:LysR family transcriptional regulator [Caenibacillus caldisaponilyticus]|uniref:LysR family transcriptional regulator n=1 Tax=Caenibacillus caldisaponilyticus TaxID=1674942 RepID=UPI0009882FD1|nr:LysR family transcriptional regulator [Caenibacillus caldisaponilyticus]